MHAHGEKRPQHRGHGISARWMLLFLLNVCVLFLYVGPVFSIHQLTVYTIREQRFWTDEDHAKAKAILVAGPVGPAGLINARFLNKVGGANFEAVATPSWRLWWTLLWKEIRLAYQLTDAAGKPLPDGQRLAVFIGRTLYRPVIPDWQLKPLAVYADRKHTAAVSLFGEGPNRQREFYITYHEAFKDTLLGLRIIQADAMFRDPRKLWELPKQNGTTVRSADERAPTAATALKAAEVIADTMARHPIRSWLLTDIRTDVTLSVEDSALHIKATPYYYLWDFRDRKTGLRLADIEEKCLSIGKDRERCLREDAKHVKVQEEYETTNYFKSNPELMENFTTVQSFSAKW